MVTSGRGLSREGMTCAESGTSEGCSWRWRKLRVYAQSGSDDRGFRMHRAPRSIQIDKGVHGRFLFLPIISARLASRVDTSRVPVQPPGTTLCINSTGNCRMWSALQHSTSLSKVQVQHHNTWDGVIDTPRPSISLVDRYLATPRIDCSQPAPVCPPRSRHHGHCGSAF
jgi:hypothetical protein